MTKLGIKNNIMAMLMCIVALASGYVGALLLAGYILLMESDKKLRKTAVKVIVIMCVSTLLLTVIGLLPDFISWLADLVGLFDGSLSVGFLFELCSVLTGAVQICETAILLVMAIGVYKNKDFSAKALDDVASTSLGYEVEPKQESAPKGKSFVDEDPDSDSVDVFN